jgi:hypothetical protein
MDIWELVSIVAICYAAYKAGQWSVVIPIVRGIQREIDEGRLVIDDEDEDGIFLISTRNMSVLAKDMKHL